jgi:predicted branched-subunit amino acid permease
MWNLATLLGALGAGIFDTNAIGLDAAVGAAFLALLVPQIRDRRGARIAIAGALLAAAAVPLTPAGVPVIVAALAVVPAVLRR